MFALVLPARCIRSAGTMMALLLMSLATASVPASDVKYNKKVLVFYPDSDNRPGILAFDRELRRVLHESGASIELFNEYLDISRFPDVAYQQELASFLKSKYRAQQPDVVIASLAPSLDFVLKYRSTICPGVPVVYGAIEKHEIEARRVARDVVGIPMTFAMEPTLQLALQLHPQLKKVYVIAGSSPYDQYWLGQARQAFEPFSRRLTFTYHSDLSLNDFQQIVSTIPPDGIIYFLHMLRDKNGVSLSSAEVVERIAPVASVPIYGHVGTYMGRGIVGGQLMEFELEARNAAELALQLLNGKKPGEVKLSSENPSHFMVDGRQLKKWGLREADLPAGTLVQFVENDFWRNYRWHVLGIISLVIAEAILITGLMLQRARRRKVERLFRLSVDSIPNGLILIGKDGRIQMANKQMEKLFGYPITELIGAEMESLLPDRLKLHHQYLRDSYLKSPVTRQMGVGRDLFGRRKDGTEFPVDIELNPILTETPIRILATIIDITERKRAEEGLSQNQKELMALTGKLMQAQESERRHIARELHDDLNQNMALLAVEIDLLAKNPPSTQALFDQSLSAISMKVKRLSSFVHDLSHQLHPAKVEQLGLVRALFGLTRDMSITYDKVIDCVADEITLPIPQHVALCLYRIAQEGLRNALKHSEAQEIMIKLFQEGEMLQMVVSDNGKGIPVQHALEFSGLGLLSMRERLRLVHGIIEIDSKPDEGTRLRVRVPLTGHVMDIKTEKDQWPDSESSFSPQTL